MKEMNLPFFTLRGSVLNQELKNTMVKVDVEVLVQLRPAQALKAWYS